MAETVVGQIALELNLDPTKLKKQLLNLNNTAQKSTSGMKSMFSGLGKTVAAALSVTAVVKFGQACLSLGSDLAEVQNVVDVTFGDMTEQANAWAQNAMESFGLSETVAKKYMGTFGAMAKSFGYSADQALGMSEQLTGLAGDVASFYNLSTDEAYTKLKSVFTGETETLKELGVVMTQSALDAYAVENGWGRTTKAMSEQEKVALRLAFVEDKLSAASGDFARTSGSWANQTRILKLRFDALRASLGRGFIAALTPVLQMINRVMAALQGLADAFASVMTRVFGDAGGWGSASASIAGNMAATVPAIGDIGTGAEDISDGMGKAADNAERYKNALFSGLDQINKVSTTPASSGSGGSGSGSGSGGGGGLIDMGGGGDMLDMGGGDLGKMSEGFKRLEEALTRLKTAFDNLRDNKVLQFFGEEIKNFVSSTALDIVTGLINALAEAMEMLNSALSGDFWGTLEHELNFITDILGVILAPLKNVITVLEDMVNKLPLPDWLKNLILKPMENAKNIIEWLQNVDFTKLVPEIKAKFMDKKEELTEKWNNLVSGIKGKIADIKASIATRWSDLKGKWNTLLGNFKGKTASMKAKVASKWADFKSKWNSLLSNFKDKTVNIGLAINSKIADLKGWVNSNIIIPINNKIQGVTLMGHQVFKNIRIPYLATGGYVRKNTPQLAVIGDNTREGEIVAPESKIAEAVAVALGPFMAMLDRVTSSAKPDGNGNINLTVMLDGRVIFKQVIDAAKQERLRTGRNPFELT
ncbi:MAG: hypothetical protein KBS74_03705 [Clostridiales bacterium]|nr:hypothetical protein [Candidatus Cacconaster stercorequi]